MSYLRYILVLSFLLFWAELASQCNLSLYAGEDVRTCTDNDVQLSASTDGVVLHSIWSPSLGLNNPFSFHPTARIDTHMTYTIVADVYDEGANLIQNFDFSAGDTSFDSQYESGSTAPGGYLIDTIGTALFDGAKPCQDPSNTGGNMMLIRVSDISDVNIWCQKVAVKTNRDYHFFAFATGLRTNDPPVIELAINDQILSSGTIGSFACSWQKVKGDWNAGGHTTANICLRVSEEDVGAGTDFALDDIHFFEVCHLEDEVEVEVVPFEVFTGDTTVQITCEEELTLSPVIESSGYPYQVLWTTEEGNLLDPARLETPRIDAPGAYHLVVNMTGLELACTQEATILVEEVSGLALSIEGPTTLHCRQPSLTLAAQHPGSNQDFIYQWLDPGGQPLGDEQSFSLDVSEAGTYQLSVTEIATGCVSSQVKVIQESQLDSFTLEALPPDCQRSYGELSVRQVFGGTPPYRYALTPNEDFQPEETFTFLPPGDYLLTVQDSLQCEISQAVTFPSIQPLLIDAPTGLELEEGDSTTLSISTNLPITELQAIKWQPSLGLSCTQCLSPMLTAKRSTPYQLTITASNGCTNTIKLLVKVKPASDVFLPNAFSPNGDGQNDTFFPLVDLDKIIRIKQFSVFDRYGGLLFAAQNVPPNNKSHGWTGQVRGLAAPAGVYTYFIELETTQGSIRQLSGQLMLLR